MKLLRYFAIVVLGFSASFAHAVGMEQFLLQNYGWTIGIKQEVKTFGFSWNIQCAPKQALPSEGSSALFGTACTQEDQRFWTVILWRLPKVTSEMVEHDVFSVIAGSQGYRKVSCRQKMLPNPMDQFGIVKDCSILLPNGTFYVSFYHFEIPMPSGGSFVNQNGEKEANLGFTIWVQNANYGISDPDVKEKLRELVSAIQTTTE